MKHTAIRRSAAGALSVALALTSVPTAAFAEALFGGNSHALATQAAGTWEHNGSTWAYRLPSGALATGWQNVDGTWYLFDASGTMLTNWQPVGNTWYFLGSSGGMYSARWLLQGETWYYLHKSGAMATGWAFVGGAWYYFYPSGAMAQDTEVDGCWLSESGAWDESARPGPFTTTRAWLTVEDSVHPDATDALLRISSDIPFAQDLSENSGTVFLSADLAKCEIVSIVRTSTNEVEVLVSGDFTPEGGEDPLGLGAIYFGPGSFADAEAEGVASTHTVHEPAVILDSQDAYADGVFNVKVDLGSAQLPGRVSPDDITLPANSDIHATVVVHDDYDNDVTIGLSVPGETPYEQYKTLDEALTAGGICFANTNIGKVVTSSANTERESMLSYVEPKLTAYVERGDDGIGYRLLDDGSASIDLVLRVLSTGGDVDLSNSQFTFDGNGLQVLDKKVAADQPDQIQLCMATLSAAEIEKAKTEVGYDSTEELLDAEVYQLANRVAEGMTIAGGVKNAWNIELPLDESVEVNVYNLAGLGESSKAPVANDGAKPLETQDQASDDDAKRVATAKQSLQTIGTIVNMIGNFVSGYEKDQAGPVISGVSMIFGLAASFLETSSWSIKDVMNRVIEMDSKMDAMSAQLGDITHQLDKIEASIDYKSQVQNITNLAQQGLRYRSAVVGAINEASGADDVDTYQLSQGTSTVTGKALQELYNQTTKQTELTGGAGATTAKIALDLGNAIVGNASTQLTGSVQSFFNYTAVCVNFEPETYYARSVFISYVGNAFVYAYSAALNELNHQIYSAKTDGDKAAYTATAEELMTLAKQVQALIGENGSMIPGTTDRADNKVLCTVNNKTFKKSSDGFGTFYAPLRRWDQQETKDVFDDMLKDRDEDEEHAYSCQNSMSRSDFETMAGREGYVRTIPGFSGATSLNAEFQLLGLLPANFSYPSSSTSSPHDYNDITWDDANSLGYALVGDPSRTDKSDAASRYHKRTYSADMYDINNNCSVGSRELYDYNVHYRAGKARWQVSITIKPVFEMRAS